MRRKALFYATKAWVMIGILFLGKGMEGRAQELSANPFGLESTSNPFSEAGSPLSVRGVDNPFGTGVKLDTSDPRDRELGLDKDPLSWEGLTEAAGQKTKELMEQNAKESAKVDLERDERLNALIRSAEKLQETSDIERR